MRPSRVGKGTEILQTVTMKQKQYSLCRRLALLFVAAFCLLPLAAQDIIRVTGRVVSSKNNHEPLFNVRVKDMKTGKIEYTDEDGKFGFDMQSNTTLQFSQMGATTQTVKVHGRQVLPDVVMVVEDLSLGEVAVTAKRITKEVTVEPTVMEIHGDTLIFPLRFRVPHKMITPHVRVIVQPIVKNHTVKDSVAVTPAVYDAKTYNLTQDRMYAWDIDGAEGDPLSNYITVRSEDNRELKNDSTHEKKKNDLVSTRVWVRVANSKHTYSCDAYLSMENYNRILFRDTVNIATGVSNPLRWLDYSFGSMQITDSSLYPKQEVQPRSSNDRVNFRFPVGKAELDSNDPQNVVEVERLRSKIEEIGRTKGTSMQKISMVCISSPEGTYAKNKELSQKRAEFATRYLKENIPASIRGNAEFKADSKVASWDDVVALMRKDTLNDEADRLADAVKPYKDPDSRWKAATRLPFYKSLLIDKYLPQLRRVDFALDYTIMRMLTAEEIQEMYDKNYQLLSRFEFFRLYRAETDSVKRETVLRRALEVYPSFQVAANDLQAELISRRAPEDSITRRFAGKKAISPTLNANHCIACLSNGNYVEADTIAAYLPETEEYSSIRAVSGVLNGKVTENFDAVAKLGPRNEVLMLIYLKKKEEALEKAKQLPTDEALTHYLLATCLNRFDDKADEADRELQKAIKMDPSLLEEAKMDADVNTLAFIKDLQKKEKEDEEKAKEAKEADNKSQEADSQSKGKASKK